MRDHDEAISVMRKSKSDLPIYKDKRYPEMLSDQLVGRQRLQPDSKRFLLTDLDLNLRAPGGLKVEIETRETFYALAPLRVLDLRLWSTHVGGVGLTGHPEEHSTPSLGEAAEWRGAPLRARQRRPRR